MWVPSDRRRDARRLHAGWRDLSRLTGIRTGSPSPSAAGSPSAGCEGWVDTPFEALADLLRHVREEP